MISPQLFYLNYYLHLSINFLTQHHSLKPTVIILSSYIIHSLIVKTSAPEASFFSFLSTYFGCCSDFEQNPVFH